MSVVANIRDVVLQLVTGNISAHDATVQLVVMMKLREMRAANMVNNHRTGDTDAVIPSETPENMDGKI